MKRIVIFCLSFFLCMNSWAQQTKGIVVDENGAPLEFVNIVLLTLPDSSFQEGTISDTKGKFCLQGKGDLVKVSSIGYQTIFLATKEISSHPIILKSTTQTLDEVVIKGTLPVHKLTEDGLETQIKGTVLGKAGTAIDVLKQIPTIQEGKDGLEVFGKGAPLIFINGRQLRDVSELTQLKSDDIKNVELITDPGARYSSSVKSVIRIKTTRPYLEGLGLAFNSEYFQADKADVNEQLDINYHINKWEFYSRYNYNYSNSWSTSDLTQSVFVDTLWQQANNLRSESQGQAHRITTGFHHALNDKMSYGGRYNLSLAPESHGNSTVHSLVSANGNYYDKWDNTELKHGTSRPSHEFNLYYNGEFGKWSADFNVDALWNGNNAFSTVNEKSAEFEDRLVESENQVRNKLFASRLILGYKLWGGKLIFGGEYTNIHRKDNYINPQQFVPTSYARLEEQNANAFLEYKRTLKFGIVQAGIRYENLNFDYYENETHKLEQSRVYSQLFPNLSFGTQLGKVQLRLGYASKVKRPSFSQLSNNVFYGNRYTLQGGNPLLKPAITHEISLQALWKFFTGYLAFNNEKDAIYYAINQVKDNPSVSKVAFDNLEKLPTLSSFISFAPKFGIWKPQLNISVRKQWLTITSNAIQMKMNQPTWSFELRQNIELPYDIIFALNFTYSTKGNYQNVYLNRTHYILDVSINKEILKDKLSIQLKGYDLLDGFRDGNYLYNNQMHMDIMNKYDRRRIGIVVRYKFNLKKDRNFNGSAGEASKSRL